MKTTAVHIFGSGRYAFRGWYSNDDPDCWLGVVPGWWFKAIAREPRG